MVKALILGTIALVLVAGCSTAPSMKIGTHLAEIALTNQQQFADVIMKSTKGMNCAIGYAKGINANQTPSTKMLLAEKELDAVVDKTSPEYKECFKFGVFMAYGGADAEHTFTKLFEKIIALK